jgi:hypothetical protein
MVFQSLRFPFGIWNTWSGRLGALQQDLRGRAQCPSARTRSPRCNRGLPRAFCQDRQI